MPYYLTYSLLPKVNALNISLCLTRIGNVISDFELIWYRLYNIVTSSINIAGVCVCVCRYGMSHFADFQYHKPLVDSYIDTNSKYIKPS